MIFKVLYQELPLQVPVRERTKSLYIEAESVRDVRAKLLNTKYNIEFIQPLSAEHLEFEQRSEDFKLEQV